MKKLFLYVFLGLLLFSNQSFAKVLHFKCTEKHSWSISVDLGLQEALNKNTFMLLKIDTDKKIMTEFDYSTNEWCSRKINFNSLFEKQIVTLVHNFRLDFCIDCCFPVGAC